MTPIIALNDVLFKAQMKLSIVQSFYLMFPQRTCLVECEINDIRFRQLSKVGYFWFNLTTSVVFKFKGYRT